MKRYDIINHLITKNGYSSYLEIGVQNKVAWDAVLCEYKVCVDPEKHYNATHIMTSDQFFKQNKEKFDIVFIDGLHEEKQVMKDIKNSLKILNPKGAIVVHDCNPDNEAMQDPDRKTKQWTGDTWKAWVKLRKTGKLKMFVYDTDFGVGVIQKGKQKPIDVPTRLSYGWFDKNRKKALNLRKINFDKPESSLGYFVMLPNGQRKKFSHKEQAEHYADASGGQVI